MISNTNHQFKSSLNTKQRYNFQDIWYALNTEKSFNYIFWLDILITLLFQKGMNCCSAFLVVIATVLISVIAFFGFTIGIYSI